MVIKDNSGNYRKRVFAHVLEPSPQNSSAVPAILNDTLIRLKANIPDLNRACIRSVNDMMDVTIAHRRLLLPHVYQEEVT